MANKAKVRARADDRGLAERISRELAEFTHSSTKLREDLAADAEIILQAHAPKGKTLRLARGIRARTVGDTTIIEAEAKNPETGFDYVGVTRFGHRVARIFPGRVARSIGSTVKFTASGTVRKRPVRGARALKTPWGPRASVRGFKPLGDWASGAREEVILLSEMKLKEFAEDVADRLD